VFSSVFFLVYLSFSYSARGLLSGYAKDWQAMQNDASKGCGANNSNYYQVGNDAYQVDNDEYQITNDDYQLGNDKYQYDLDLSAVQSDVQSANTDWTKLQNAAKANTTKKPAPAYTQNDIDTATTNAQNAENTASNTWTSAKTSAGTYDSEASDLKKKADAIPGSMGCI
jgi:hypothetical protein